MFVFVSSSFGITGLNATKRAGHDQIGVVRRLLRLPRPVARRCGRLTRGRRVLVRERFAHNSGGGDSTPRCDRLAHRVARLRQVRQCARAGLALWRRVVLEVVEVLVVLVG